jgi:hypothetical protein
MLYLMWALAGWCGTPWPHWPGPGPGPGPDPNPWYDKVAGVIGGVIGGWLTTKILTVATATAVTDNTAAMFVATMAGAFVAGRVLSDIVGLTIGKGAGANVGVTRAGL